MGDEPIRYEFPAPGANADHPFVASSIEDLKDIDRCAWARSRTDATTVCWRPRSAHPSTTW